MGQLYQLRCRSCGEKLLDRHWAYCQCCNLQLIYRAMPLILGMFFDGTLHIAAVAPGVKFYKTTPRWPIYEHARYILD